MRILRDLAGLRHTMFEEAEDLNAGLGAASLRSPAWADRLERALAANTTDIYAPALDLLRRGGFAPAPPFAPAAVLIALIEEESGPGVLLTRRRDELPRHGGQVAFPGGAAEATESAEQTALREAGEEVALAPERVRLLGRLPRYPTTSGYLVTPVVGYVSAAPPLRAQPGEVADIFILPFGVLLDPACWQTRPIGTGETRLMLPELAWAGQRVWGATAGMLQMLIPSLREVWDCSA